MNVRVPGSFVMVLLGCTGCVSSPATEDHDILNSEFPAARAEIETKMRTMDELVNTLDELRDLHLDSPKFSKLGDNAPRKGFEEMIAEEWSLASGLEGWSFDPRDLKVDVFGDVAVATCYPHYILHYGDAEPVEFKTVSTLVWVRTGEGWKIAHEHHTTITAD